MGYVIGVSSQKNSDKMPEPTWFENGCLLMRPMGPACVVLYQTHKNKSFILMNGFRAIAAECKVKFHHA
jgi:hypothetical protein